jgi:uncharacterized membrane protein YeiH
MIHGQFDLPQIYQVIAVFLLAVTGAMLAIQKKYDISGVVIMAFITGVSGAIIRDSIFLNQVPIVIEQWRYLFAVVLAAIITPLTIDYIKRITSIFVAIDALGLGIFGIISTQMALNANLNVIAAIFIGLIGAVSGGLLRDTLTKSQPLLLKPGQYYFTAVLSGILLFILLTIYLSINAQFAAILAIILIFAMRMLSYKYNWQSLPAEEVAKKILKK